MFNSQLLATDEYLFDLTTTLEEEEVKQGVVRKSDGSINIRRTVFNVARNLSQQSDGFCFDNPTAWGNTAFSDDAIEAVLFQLDIELEPCQIRRALSFWVARGILRRWLSVRLWVANNR